MNVPNRLGQERRNGEDLEGLEPPFLGDMNRIDDGHHYITNYKTSKTPTLYYVEIWRDLMVGGFTFETKGK